MQNLIALFCVTCVLSLTMQATGQGLISQGLPRLGASNSVTTTLQQAYQRAQVIRKNLPTELKKASKCQGISGCAMYSAGESSASVSLEYAAYKLLLSPMTWDSRDSQLTYGVDVISPSIDQRPCSTCTAMAVTSAAETAVAMTLQNDVSDLNMSEMDMYYCSQTTKRSCDTGAILSEAINDLVTGPPLSASCLPYKAAPDLVTNGVCKSKSCSEIPDLVQKGNFGFQELRNPYDVMDYIKLYGSVVTPFYITNDFKTFYDDESNQKEIYYYPTDPQTQPGAEGHAVVLVGYNLDFSDFSRSYWIVKNSWGPQWADDGFFKVSYNFSSFKDYSAYLISWKPDADDLPDYTALKGLTPVNNQPGCCKYKANKYDLLSRVVLQGDLDPLKLLTNNPGINPPSGSLAGRTLLLCGSVCQPGGNPADTSQRQGFQDYAVTLRRIVKDHELNCNYIDEWGRRVNYCRVCGGVESVATQCDADPDCAYFDMADPEVLPNGTVKWCGYLKKAATGLLRMNNYVNYCKIGPGSECTGTYTYRRGLGLSATADLDCNYKDPKDGKKQKYCFVSGNVVELAGACDASNDCQAFEYVDASGKAFSSYGGNLTKFSSDSVVSKPGTAIYVKRGTGVSYMLGWMGMGDAGQPITGSSEPMRHVTKAGGHSVAPVSAPVVPGQP